MRANSDRNELGICQWNGTPEGAVAAKPATEFLNCNVNNQDVDCDDGLPFTFDYCALDPDVLKYDWASPEEAPENGDDAITVFRACPRYITPFLDQIDTKGLHECCEEVTDLKLKSNESWFVTTGDLPLSEPPPAMIGRAAESQRASIHNRGSSSTMPDVSPSGTSGMICIEPRSFIMMPRIAVESAGCCRRVQHGRPPPKRPSRKPRGMRPRIIWSPPATLQPPFSRCAQRTQSIKDDPKGHL